MGHFTSHRPPTQKGAIPSCGVARRLIVCSLTLLAVLAAPAAAIEDEPEGAAGKVLEKARENPIPADEASIAKGRTLYLHRCQTCHGYDGRALENIDFEAADLTAPSRWRFGTREGDIFRTTRDGAAEEMPPFRSQLTDDEIWHVVNYVRSLWSEDERAKVEAPVEPGER